MTPRHSVAARVAALLLAALLVDGCMSPRSRWVSPTSGTPSGSASPPASQAAWRPCPEIAKDLLQRTPENVEFGCAKIQVPQDWQTAVNGVARDGETFELALVRVRSITQSADQRIGSIVVNPGGPGSSGIDLAVYLSTALPAELAKRFDIVGFDPRGVGRSTQVRCFSDRDLDDYFGADPDPSSQSAFNEAVALQRRMAQACGDKYGDSLRLFSTEQTARDLDAIRAAIGDEKLSYLGFSYGTLLGAVYAHLFPQRVRALVLDGAVDPTSDSLQAADNQAKGFERAFTNFVNWCTATPGECPIAPNARDVVDQVMRTARTNPVRGAGGRRATSGWVMTAIVSSLYSQASWRRLANALDRLRDGTAGEMFALADEYADRKSTGRYSNLFDANAAINCTDDDKTPSVERLRQYQSELRAKYPMFGSSSALNLICAQWPGKRDPYPAGPATGAPPILVVGTTGDPATPYEQTAKLADLLGVGAVLTWQGEGHTAYLRTRCVTSAVNQYLLDLTVPAKGTVCPPK